MFEPLRGLHRQICVSSLALIFLLGPSASAQTYISNIAPYTFYSESGAPYGVVYETIRLLAERRGYRGTIEMVPLRRRIALISSRRDTFGTLWRVEDNNADFHWLFKILDEQAVLLTMRGRSIDISSAIAARNLRIGVVLGSPAEALAKKLGFQHLETAASAESNVRKLALGRIDAWLALESVIAYAERGAGGEYTPFRRGAIVGTIGLYFACGLHCDETEYNQWLASYKGAKSDGTIDHIYMKYGARVP